MTPGTGRRSPGARKSFSGAGEDPRYGGRLYLVWRAVFGPSLVGRRRDVDTADHVNGETGTASLRSAVGLIVASEIAGILVAGCGFLIVVNALPFWLPIYTPGVIMGPPSYVQWWDAQLVHGSMLAGAGVILMLGSALIRRFWRKGAARAPRSAHKALAVLLLLAIGLTSAAGFANLLSPTQRSVQFAASGFTLESLPGNVPYENYFVSEPFQAYAGESLFPEFNLTQTDNQTGALENWNPFASTWYTSPSALLNRSDPSEWAFGAVVPRDGTYVLWVRYDFCATPGTFPCNNYTGSVRGALVISNALAYEPWILGLSLSGSVAMVAAVAQSAKGRRRATS